jgi:outer membrane protein assembly factor BamB
MKCSNQLECSARNCSLAAALVATLAANFVAAPAFADDWPQWRGPNRDGTSREKGLLKEWPADGPKLLWQVQDLDDGFSTPSVVGERLYVQTNKGTEDEFLQARNIKDGKQIWSVRIGKVGNPDQKPSYPAARSTPTVTGDALYALGSDGDLVCLETASGKERWRKSLRDDFGGKPGRWAYSESPLVDGDKVVCTPGGREATLLALDRKSGELAWTSALPEGDDAAYASIIVVEAAGTKQYVQLLQKGLVGVDAKTGKLLWRYSKPVSVFDANIPTPTAADGLVYVGSAGTGGGAVKLLAKDGAVDFEPLYFDAKMPTAIGGTVRLGDYLYGTTAQSMLCIEFKSGEVKWQNRALGAASLCFADGRLYLHGENGDVALVEPSPEAYREKGRFTPPDQPKHANPMAKAWSYPVVANGRLYVRDLTSLWCYQIGAKE